MEAIIALIIQYAAIWGPSLVAVFSVVATVIAAINKTRAAIQEFKNDKTVAEMNEEMKRMENKLSSRMCEEEELIRCNKLLLDELTKIKGYADHKKEE